MKKLVIWAIVLGCGAYFGSKMLLHHKVGKGVDGALLMMSPFANIEYEGVSSTMSGELTIDGITMRVIGYNDEIRIDRIGIDTPSYFSLLNLTDIAENIHSPDEVIPESFGFIAEGVRMRVNSDYMKEIHRERINALNVSDIGAPAAECAGKYGYSPRALSKLGYSEQVASVSAHFKRGHGDYSILIASSIEDMWSIDGELTLAGDMISEVSKGSRYRPRMKAMHIEYEDLSLNERVRKYCGSLGLSDDEILQAQLDTLHFFGKENGIEFDEYVIDPFTQFLNGKSRLVVTANPREPIAISQISLYKPSDVPALLELSAEAY
ncbi:MAG: hypothetical protein AAFN50_02545 [Pseudomonadota bacterium]